MSSDKYEKIGTMIAQDIIRNGLSLSLPSILAVIEKAVATEMANTLRITNADLGRLLGVSYRTAEKLAKLPPKTATKNIPPEEYARFSKKIDIAKDAPTGEIAGSTVSTSIERLFSRI